MNSTALPGPKFYFHHGLLLFTCAQDGEQCLLVNFQWNYRYIRRAMTNKQRKRRTGYENRRFLIWPPCCDVWWLSNLIIIPDCQICHANFNGLFRSNMPIFLGIISLITISWVLKSLATLLFVCFVLSFFYISYIVKNSCTRRPTGRGPPLPVNITYSMSLYSDSIIEHGMLLSTIGRLTSIC